MKQEIRAFLDTMAQRRSVQLRKQDPSAIVTYMVDDVSPRAVIKVANGEETKWLEFLESADTLANPSIFDDYVYSAQQFRTITIHVPEANYTREVALTILNDVLVRLKGAGVEGDIKMVGYLYDNIGTFKKIK